MNIGITERGDPVFDFNWLPWVQEKHFPAILITKNPMLLWRFLARTQHSQTFNIIVHCTITGYGGTIIEPGVPNWQEALEGCYYLSKYLGLDRIVLRVDPIIPTEKGTDLAISVVEAAKTKISENLRVRISFIDYYDHVKARFKAIDASLPWDSFHAPLDIRKAVWKKLGKPEICGEPDFECTGCVSEIDCRILNVDPIDISKGQRRFCACLMNKKELLTSKTRCAHMCVYCYYGKHD
ncbi:MAG: DUF1848 family protein [Nitrosarchaeum sp.]|nr:DUF1848 family protein [Nitrosarchaeum sp.]